MPDIKFGTDGWRGVIADDFTFENVGAVAQATAEYIHEQGEASQGVVVGYDTRFQSAGFARHTAEVMAANDIPVHLTSSYIPTPVLSHAVRELGAAAGVMITASHNPARWNGFKIKLATGAPATEAVTGAIERALALAPDDPIALLERGNIRRLLGDDAGAHADWIRVLSVAPGGRAAGRSQHDGRSRPRPAHRGK